jgi:protein arginine kinase activator
MVCNLCGVNESTIHLTEIVNNQMVEIHLCETCAQEKGTDFKTHFNVGDLLAGLTDISKLSTGLEKTLAQCPQCAMTYEEFGKKGRLGCSTCYAAFEKLLIPLIRRVQRSTSHLGKRPSHLPKQPTESGDLRLLQQRLRKSIQAEAFEEAAEIRDKIRVLEEKLSKLKIKKKNNKND